MGSADKEEGDEIMSLVQKIPIPNLKIPTILINPRPDERIDMRLMVIPWLCFGLEDGHYYENKILEISIDVADEDFYYP